MTMRSEPETTRYPRTLVVMQEPFNNICGAGITVSNLFAGWPKDRLASIYWSTLHADERVCARRYRLSQQELRWRFPLDVLLASSDRKAADVSPALQSPADVRPGGAMAGVRRIATSAARSCWRQLNRTIGGFEFMLETELSHELALWIQQFDPEVIYCAPTNYPIISLVEKMAAFTGVPMVIHIYDDWLSVAGEGGLLQPHYGKVTTAAFTRLLKKAANRFVISEEMSAEFHRRYGMRFEPFHNCPDPGLWLEHRRTTYAAGTPFVFRFIGEIYYNGNANTLLELSAALRLLRTQGVDASLEIYTNAKTIGEFRSQFSDGSIVSLQTVPEESEAVAALCAGADGLIIAYDFDEFSANRFRFSLPTKFPAYLLSGSPVVVYAPDSLAVTKRAAHGKIALVLSRRLPLGELSERLRVFIGDEKLRRELAERGSRYAMGHLIGDVVRPRFREAMNRSASRPADRPAGQTVAAPDDVAESAVRP